MSKRYKIIGFSTDIYCSSSGDHFADVWYTDGKKKQFRQFHFEGDGLLYKLGFGYVKVPKYLTQAIKQRFLEFQEAGKIRVHEIVGGDYRGERPKRYEDLRYHDPDWLARKADEWRKELE